MSFLKSAIIQQCATQELSDTSISIRFVKCLSAADTEKCQRYLVRSSFFATSWNHAHFLHRWDSLNAPTSTEHTHPCADNFYIVAIFQRLSDKLLFDCHKEPDRRTMAKANKISDGWVLKQSFTVNNLAEANSAHIHTHTHLWIV